MAHCLGAIGTRVARTAGGLRPGGSLSLRSAVGASSFRVEEMASPLLRGLGFAFSPLSEAGRGALLVVIASGVWMSAESLIPARARATANSQQKRAARGRMGLGFRV